MPRSEGRAEEQCMRDGFTGLNAYYRYVRHYAPLVNKQDLVLSKARGRTVLDLGCVGHTARRALEDPNWLHARIRSVAREVVGVDILPQDIEQLHDLGYDGIVCADATRLALGRFFDVVVMGDLIEHVPNLEGLLSSVQAHLQDDGEVVVTTCNPFYIRQFISILVSNRVTVNDEHVCWFDPLTIYQLLTSHGFSVVEFYWLRPSVIPGSCPKGEMTARRSAGVVANRMLAPLRMLRLFRRYLNSDFAVVATKRAAEL